MYSSGFPWKNLFPLQELKVRPHCCSVDSQSRGSVVLLLPNDTLKDTKCLLGLPGCHRHQLWGCRDAHHSPGAHQPAATDEMDLDAV